MLCLLLEESGYAVIQCERQAAERVLDKKAGALCLMMTTDVCRRPHEQRSSSRVARIAIQLDVVVTSGPSADAAFA